MPVARFQMPDGRIGRFEVPDGTTPDQAQQMIQQSLSAPPVRPQSQQAPQQQTTNGPIVDSANAMGTGYWRGLTRLAGLPVDAAANVIDLGKAGIGSAYTAITGKPSPDALQLKPRNEVFGSGDYLLEQLRKTKLKGLVDPSNPEYEGGVAQAAGAGLTGIMSPTTKMQAVNQGALGVLGSVGGNEVAKATGNPALAITASLLPGAAQQAAVSAAKRVIRGDSLNPMSPSAGSEMRQRVQDLKNAGIDSPTLGLASGNKLIGGMENILQSTPGAIGRMGNARDSALNGLRGTTEEAANLASPTRGAFESGVAIQSGIKNFKDAYKGNQTQLYDELDKYIPGQTPSSVANTKQTLGVLNQEIPGAENLSRFFKNEKIMALEDALRKDTAGSPASVHVYPQPPKASGDLMNTPVPQAPKLVEIPAGPDKNTLPFEALKKTRTLVGNEIADNSLLSAVPQGKWRSLYGGLSEDMGNAAREAGPQAQQAFNRATDYTRAGTQRLERVAPFAQTAAPEQAYTTLVNSAKENVSTLQALKKSLPDEARGTIAGTIIERLGKATSGVQNESGTVWSPETFLTNWNKMTPKARD